MAPLPEGVAKSMDETKVDYKLVGNSGLRVSVPIIGCMSIGNPEWASWVQGPEKALPLLKAAYDRGINTVCALLMLRSINLILTRCSGIQQIFIPTEILRELSPRRSRNTIFHDTSWCS